MLSVFPIIYLKMINCRVFPSIDINFIIDSILSIDNKLFYFAKSYFSLTNQSLIII